MKQTLASYMEALRGRRVDVVGMGVSNRPLVELLLQHGAAVTVLDKREKEKFPDAEALEARGVRLFLGADYMEHLSGEIVFRTPGMHPDTPALKQARERGAEIRSEMEAFFAVCPCHILAVTGSDGKTTTTTIISELLKAEGKRVHLGGNIGQPLLAEADAMQPEDWAVLELSSFQLCQMSCRPDVAVITNISPNHLDIHPSMEDYINAKKQIFRGQTAQDRLVLNLDNEITAALAGEAQSAVSRFSRRSAVETGTYLADGMIFRAQNGESMPLMPASDILLPGLHNVENYLAAFSATAGLVSDETCRKVAKEFSGVEHRLELVRRLRGVSYYNDSIASSPTRTIAGLRSFHNTNLILIAGGYDKHIPFENLGVEIVEKVKALVLCGATADKILAAVQAAPGFAHSGLPIRVVETFAEAVSVASSLAEEGDSVLLSPACASFDQFANFAERGNTFKRLVNEMK